jgi:formate dehydrogenase
MTPHYSGTTLDAQARYAAGAQSILDNFLSDKPQDPANVIVGIGKYETKACEQLDLAISCSLINDVLSDGQR